MDTSQLVPSREVLATCWTWAGDAAPGRADERSPVDLRARIDAVSSADWSGVGLVLADLAVVQADVGFAELRRMLDGAGIARVELEFLTDWWKAAGPLRRASDDARRLLFEAAEALGARTVKVSGQYAVPPVDWSVFAESLDALAREAADHGTRVAVEPMPMNNIRTLERGMELIAEIDNPAAGLCLDTQHVHRGGTAYKDLGSVLQIEKVFVVELDDSLEAFVGATPFDDAVNHRLLPGDGELAVAEFVAEMVRLGWGGPWGVEIMSDAHRALPVDLAVQHAFDATMKTLDEAESLLRGRSEV